MALGINCIALVFRLFGCIVRFGDVYRIYPFIRVNSIIICRYNISVKICPTNNLWTSMGHIVASIPTIARMSASIYKVFSTLVGLYSLWGTCRQRGGQPPSRSQRWRRSRCRGSRTWSPGMTAALHIHRRTHTRDDIRITDYPEFLKIEKKKINLFGTKTTIQYY